MGPSKLVHIHTTQPQLGDGILDLQELVDAFLVFLPAYVLNLELRIGARILEAKPRSETYYRKRDSTPGVIHVDHRSEGGLDSQTAHQACPETVTRQPARVFPVFLLQLSVRLGTALALQLYHGSQSDSRLNAKHFRS